MPALSRAWQALLANRRPLHLGAMPIYLVQLTSAHTLGMERSAAVSQGGRRTKFQRDKKSNAEGVGRGSGLSSLTVTAASLPWISDLHVHGATLIKR